MNRDEDRIARDHLHLLYAHPGAVLYLDRTSNGFVEGAVVHLDLISWSHSQFRDYLKIWKLTKSKLKEAGFKCVYATPVDEIARKLVSRFGFTDTGVTVSGVKLMRSELCQY